MRVLLSVRTYCQLSVLDLDAVELTGDQASFRMSVNQYRPLPHWTYTDQDKWLPGGQC